MSGEIIVEIEWPSHREPKEKACISVSSGVGGVVLGNLGLLHKRRGQTTIEGAEKQVELRGAPGNRAPR